MNLLYVVEEIYKTMHDVLCIMAKNKKQIWVCTPSLPICMSCGEDCYVVSYVILDSVCAQWETRCDILVIQGFNHKALVSPSPNFKDICEGRGCHRWFHIYFVHARRCALSGHGVCCERGASIIFFNHSVPSIFCRLCAWVRICKTGYRVYQRRILATPAYSAFIYMILFLQRMSKYLNNVWLKITFFCDSVQLYLMGNQVKLKTKFCGWRKHMHISSDVTHAVIFVFKLDIYIPIHVVWHKHAIFHDHPLAHLLPPYIPPYTPHPHPPLTSSR